MLKNNIKPNKENSETDKRIKITKYSLSVVLVVNYICVL